MLQDTLWTLQDIGWTTLDENISKLKVRRFPVNYVGKIYNRDLIIGNAYNSKSIKQRKIKLSQSLGALHKHEAVNESVANLIRIFIPVYNVLNILRLFFLPF